MFRVKLEGDLFTQIQKLEFFDGKLVYYPRFIEKQESLDLYHDLLANLQWSQAQIKMFGKLVTIPRLQAWYGDSDAYYKYSGLPLKPLPWLDVLTSLKIKCEQALGKSFNSVLANYYRDNRDSMGWHSDNEKQLGDLPIIASLSFGQQRRFCMRQKSTGEKFELNLQSGSLLVMQSNIQTHWQHSLPKSAKPLSGRINLTYRRIYNEDQNDNRSNN
mgnify:CR=1 FL=1